MLKLMRLVLLFTLFLLVGSVSAQATDWWTWVYQGSNDTLALRNAGGVQLELPRPRLPNEAPSGVQPQISVSPDGRTLIVAAPTADNRVEIGFYNIPARQWIRTHQTDPEEFIATNIAEVAVFDATGERAAISFTTPVGRWRVILFEVATGNVLELLTSDNPALAAINLVNETEAYPYVLGFAGSEVWMELLIPNDEVALRPFVWLPDEDTVGVSEYYGLVSALQNGTLVFPYLDVTMPQLEVPGVLTSYNSIGILEGGELFSLWTDETRVHYSAAWGAGGDLVLFQAGDPTDTVQLWYALGDDLPIPLAENVSIVYGTPSGFLSLSDTGAVAYHDVEDPAQGETVFTLGETDRILWSLAEDIGFDPAALSGQQVNVPTATPQPCLVRTDWFAYTVVRGDTLGSIARRSGSSIAELAQGNCLTNVNIILVGQTIYTPRVPATPTPAPVQITVFTVSPTTAAPGQTVNLRWEMRGANRATIRISSPDNLYNTTFDNLPASGTLSYTVPEIFAGGLPPRLNIVLTPQPATGVSSAITLTIANQSLPEIASFAVTPATAVPGQTVTLNWDVRNTQSVTINISSPDGIYRESLTNLPIAGNRTFRVPEVFAGGVPAQLNIQIVPQPDRGVNRTIPLTLQTAPLPQIVSFNVNPTLANPGQTVTVTWQATNTPNVRLNVYNQDVTYNNFFENLPASGSLNFTVPEVFPGGLPPVLFFQLVTIPDVGVNRTIELELEAAQPQINSFTVDTLTAVPGQTITLTWGVVNAQTVSVRVVLPNGTFGPWFNDQPAAGSLTYTIPADSPAGTYGFQLVPLPESGVVQTVNVTVTP